MGSLRGFGLIGAFAILLPSAQAVAADLPVVYEAPPPVPYEMGSGWYLRGDLGYKWYSAPSAHFDVPGYGNMIGESLANTGMAGAGFGYRWNDYFRTDFTLDYEWPANFHGRLPCPSPCGGSGSGLYSDEYAKISAWSGLVNAYFDFPIGGEGLSGFTPYIGAGIGASYLETSGVRFVNPNGSTGTWNGASKWNLAWAVTVGASYALSQNWLVDVNYRYLNLGDAASGPTSPVFGNQAIKYDNIDAHEVRVGFRYLIN
jgi:opacity protein-like surface antigen